MRASRLVVAIGACALVAGALWLRHGLGDPEPATQAAPAATAAADAPPPRRAALPIRADRTPVLAAAALAEPSAAEPPHPVSESEIDTRYARLFDGAERGTAWSRAAVQRARERLPGAVPEGSEVTDVECRGQLCRLESRHRDKASFERYVQAALVDDKTYLWNGGFRASVTEAKPGELRVVTFLAAEGTGLPPP